MEAAFAKVCGLAQEQGIVTFGDDTLVPEPTTFPSASHVRDLNMDSLMFVQWATAALLDEHQVPLKLVMMREAFIETTEPAIVEAVTRTRRLRDVFNCIMHIQYFGDRDAETGTIWNKTTCPAKGMWAIVDKDSGLALYITDKPMVGRTEDIVALLGAEQDEWIQKNGGSASGDWTSRPTQKLYANLLQACRKLRAANIGLIQTLIYDDSTESVAVF
jgi:hypothetical protein